MRATTSTLQTLNVIFTTSLVSRDIFSLFSVRIKAFFYLISAQKMSLSVTAVEQQVSFTCLSSCSAVSMATKFACCYQKLFCTVLKKLTVSIICMMWTRPLPLHQSSEQSCLSQPQSQSRKEKEDFQTVTHQI